MRRSCVQRSRTTYWVALIVVSITVGASPSGSATLAFAPTRQEAGMFAESQAYERFMGRWSRQMAPLLVTFAGIRDGDTVLDVGSGTGALATAIAHAHPTARIVGVDASAAYVKYAQSHARNERVQFTVGDAQQLRLDEGTFDGALSLLVMNFIPRPADAVREQRRVTKPGGVIAAAVWDYGEGMQMLRTFWDEAVALNPAAERRDERHMPLCTAGALSELWRAQGLVEISEQPLVIEMVFPSFDEYWTPFLGGQGPAGAYVASLSEADRDALRLRLYRRLVGDGPDRAITLQARAWAVKGRVPLR